jgi:hypothetical protein
VSTTEQRKTFNPGRSDTRPSEIKPKKDRAGRVVLLKKNLMHRHEACLGVLVVTLRLVKLVDALDVGRTLKVDSGGAGLGRSGIKADIRVPVAGFVSYEHTTRRIRTHPLEYVSMLMCTPGLVVLDFLAELG